MTKPEIAIFDLDRTLIDGDTNALWIDFLVALGELPDSVRAWQLDYLARYEARTLDIDAYLEFHLGLLAAKPVAHWLPLRERFIDICVVPRISAAAREALIYHRAKGDHVLIITATHSFLAEAVAAQFGVEVIAPQAQQVEGRFTGRSIGPISFGVGKLACLQHWLAPKGLSLGACRTWFYSDSINDQPLLEAVTHPVVVNADAALSALARVRGWPRRVWRVEERTTISD